MNRSSADWLKKSLKLLFRYLDESYDINAGGCCFVAYCIAKNLESLGESYKLVLYDGDSLKDTDSTEIEKNIENRDIQKCPNGSHTCWHYAIKTENLGVINASDCEGDRSISVHASSSDILWIYEQGDWNSCYDYELNDIVKENIDLIFNAYERIFK